MKGIKSIIQTSILLLVFAQQVMLLLLVSAQLVKLI